MKCNLSTRSHPHVSVTRQHDLVQAEPQSSGIGLTLHHRQDKVKLWPFLLTKGICYATACDAIFYNRVDISLHARVT